MSTVLAYVSAAIVAVWGILHAVPTRQVLAGFQPITVDNRRVITQEWLAEALTMWGIAAVVIAATAAGGTATNAGRGFTAPHPGYFLAWQRSPH